jgi:type VI secretion system protein VasI
MGNRTCPLVVTGTVAATFLWTAFGWAAQDQPDQPRACAQIQNDAARLECYDLKFRKSSAVTQPAETDWVVKEEHSKIDDSTNVFLKINSTDSIKNQYGVDTYFGLFIRCEEKQTDMFIVFGDYFMSSLNGAGTITYRVDQQPAKKKALTESNDHKALGLWSAVAAVPFVKELFSGSTLLVRATPYSDSTVTAEFRIAGIEDAIKPLRAACKW